MIADELVRRVREAGADLRLGGPTGVELLRYRRVDLATIEAVRAERDGILAFLRERDGACATDAVLAAQRLLRECRWLPEPAPCAFHCGRAGEDSKTCTLERNETRGRSKRARHGWETPNFRRTVASYGEPQFIWGIPADVKKPRFAMRQVLTALLLLGVSPGPSLAQTDAWIEANLPISGYTETIANFWYASATYRVHGCVLNMHVSDKFAANFAASSVHNTPPPTTWQLAFRPATGSHFTAREMSDGYEDAAVPFADISPSDVEISQGGVLSTLPPLFVGSRRLVFTFNEKSHAERVRHAMLHAIYLCGGKRDAF